VPNIPQTELPKPKSWDEFEDIVADLYKRLWDDPHAKRYGRTGQAQQGVDIYGRPAYLEGGYAGVQCKRYEVGTLDLKVVEDEVAKADGFEPSLVEYTIVTTDRRDAKLQKAVRLITQEREAAGKFPVHIVFWEDLCDLLCHPDNYDLLLKHYGDWLRLVARPTSAHQLPAPPADFTGREDEIAGLLKAIEEGGVTISGLRGMGGIGKTALALKLARQLTPRYPDAQIFLDLKGTDPRLLTPTQAMGYVVHALHPHIQLPASEAEVSGLYRSLLRDKRALLLLDDAAGADQVNPLIPPASCATIVTSRQIFHLAGMQSLNLDTLPPEDARAFLLRIDERIGDCAGEIARLCGCLPLALKLAGRTLAERVDLSPAEYVNRLHDRRTRLGLVEASVDLSYDLLDEEHQHRWARLSAFANPFERDAAAAVWEMGLDSAHDVLGELVRRSLVGWDGESARYRLHDLLRDYAYERLRETEDARPVHRLMAEYLRAKLADEERGGTPAEILEEVDQWEQAEDWETFAGRANALVGSLDRQGYWAEIEERLGRALAAVREHLETPSKLEAALLGNLGTVASKRAEWDRAIEMYKQSLETFERVGDVHGMALTHNNLGLVYADKGEWDRAIEFYQNALQKLERVGDVLGMALTHNNLGLVYADKGEWDRAIEFYQNALQTLERLGGVHGMAQTYINLGSVYLQKEEWDRAIEFYQKNLEISERLGDVHGMAQTMMGLGLVYAGKGEWDRAIEFYQKDLEISERVGDVLGMARTFGNLGLVYADKGEWGRATEFYQKNLEISERLGDVHGMALT
jgi:tetratricopeptide (TPR) repeat protein